MSEPRQDVCESDLDADVPGADPGIEIGGGSRSAIVPEPESASEDALAARDAVIAGLRLQLEESHARGIRLADRNIDLEQERDALAASIRAVVARHEDATGYRPSDDAADNVTRLDFSLDAVVEDRDRAQRLHQRALAANRVLRGRPKPKPRRKSSRR